MADFLANKEIVNDFVADLRRFVRNKDLAGALALIRKNADTQEIQDNVSQVLPVLVAHLSYESQTKKPKLFSCCVKALNVIAERFDAESVLLQLMFDVEKAKDDTAFLTLLHPLQKVLLRLEKRRLDFIGWGLNSVRLYLNTLPVPENLNLEKDEEMLMDADPIAERISVLYFSLLPFYEVLIKDLHMEEAFMQQRKVIFSNCLLRLLGIPLAYLNLNSNAKTTTRARRIGERIVDKVLSMERDIYKILERQAFNRQVDHISMATFFYLVFSDKTFLDKIPKIYDSIHIFQTTLPLATELLTHDNQFAVVNGLNLSEALLNMVKGNVLSHTLLDSKHHSKFCIDLSNVIIFNALEASRKEGLGVLKKYIFSFGIDGRHLIVYNLMKVLNHTGLIGYLISLYKDVIMAELNKTGPLSTFVMHQKLFVMLDLFCYLPKGEESDVIELADQIVAALNLLRYLAIRDVGNVMGIWEYFKVLNKSFFEPLRKGLDLSKAHYKFKIKELKMENDGGKSDDPEVSVVVAGQELVEMTTNEKLQIVNAALTTFDVIESLLCRLTELIQIRLDNPF